MAGGTWCRAGPVGTRPGLGQGAHLSRPLQRGGATGTHWPVRGRGHCGRHWVTPVPLHL